MSARTVRPPTSTSTERSHPGCDATSELVSEDGSSTCTQASEPAAAILASAELAEQGAVPAPLPTAKVRTPIPDAATRSNVLWLTLAWPSDRKKTHRGPL